MPGSAAARCCQHDDVIIKLTYISNDAKRSAGLSSVLNKTPVVAGVLAAKTLLPSAVFGVSRRDI